ncbi:hypothetical protein KCU71_g2698, partial [Aureobasidium melanogenum]
MAQVLLRIAILIFEGELLFIWGVTIYSLFWYGWTYRRSLAVGLAGCLAGLFQLAGQLATLSGVGLFLVATCVLGLLQAVFRQTQSSWKEHSRSSPSFPTTTQPYSVATLQTPAVVCLAQNHAAYSYDHENNLLDDINDLIRPIHDQPLSIAASNNDRTSRDLITTKEELRHAYILMRNTVVPNYLNMQTIEKEQDSTSVLSALSTLRSLYKSCQIISASLLDQDGVADVLSHELARLDTISTDRANERLDLLRAMLSAEICFTEAVDTLETDWALVSRGSSRLGEKDLDDIRRLRVHWPTVTTGP